METWVSVCITALAAMGRIFMLCTVGFTCAQWPKNNPLLGKQTVQILSRLCNTLFLPCLIISVLGSGLSIDSLGRMIILFPFSLVNLGIGYGIAFTLGRLIHEDDELLFVANSVALGSPNVVSFPLMVMETLCKQSEEIQLDFPDSETCFVETSSMIFVYSIGWHLVFWSVGYPRLQTLNEDAKVDNKKRGILRSIWKSIKIVIYRTVTAPPIVCTAIGITIGVIEPLKNALFKDFTALTPIGSTLKTISDPIICLMSLIMSSSLASVQLFPKSAKDTAISEDSFEVEVNTVSDVVEADCGITIHKGLDVHFDNDYYSSNDLVSRRGRRSMTETDIDYLKEIEMKSLSAAESNMETNVEFMNLNNDQDNNGDGANKDDDSNNSTSSKEKENVDGHIVPPQYRSVFAMLFCRLVAPPLCTIPIILALKHSGIVTNDRRPMMIVALLASAAPSAQIMIVSLNQLGLAKYAAKMAYIYFFQYTFAILTITVWTTVGIIIVYD